MCIIIYKTHSNRKKISCFNNKIILDIRTNAQNNNKNDHVGHNTKINEFLVCIKKKKSRQKKDYYCNRTTENGHGRLGRLRTAVTSTKGTQRYAYPYLTKAVIQEHIYQKLIYYFIISFFYMYK